MIQTWAILVDAYRDLASRKLFWFALGLSLIIVLAFASIGLDDKGWSILWWHFDNEFANSRIIPPERFYRGMFDTFGVSVWLAWGAMILAIVSSGSIFPDLISSGSIDLVLAKPITRSRLFLLKFGAGLLFTALQVTVFTTACFLTFGFRGGVWIPKLFWAVPIMVLLFSYLFSVCALLGLITRSALTSIMLTLLLWLGIFLINSADGFVLSLRVENDINRERVVTRLEKQRAAAVTSWKSANPAETREPTETEIGTANPFLADTLKRQSELDANGKLLRQFETTIVGVKSILPKTTETLEVLKRQIGIAASNAPEDRSTSDEEVSLFSGRMSRRDEEEVRRRRDQAVAHRTTAWIIWTSVAFEAVVLGIAATVFRRRDF